MQFQHSPFLTRCNMGRPQLPFSIQQVSKLLLTQKGVHPAVVTAGHCMHAELTSGSGHGLASCYSCCMHSHSLC